LLELGEDAFEAFAVVGQDEVVLGREVREERPGCQLGLARDLLDRRLVEAFAFEQFECDVFESSSALTLVSFSSSGRFGHERTLSKRAVIAKMQ